MNIYEKFKKSLHFLFSCYANNENFYIFLKLVKIYNFLAFNTRIKKQIVFMLSLVQTNL